MAKRKAKAVKAPKPVQAAPLDPEPIEAQPEPIEVPAEEIPAIIEPVGGDWANDVPKVCTIDDLVQEYFPGATKVSGGVASGLNREMRRRNRKAERGY